jgi:hypothetical protein
MKILSIVLIGCLLGSSVAAFGVAMKDNASQQMMSTSLLLSRPVLVKDDQYYTVELAEATSAIIIPGEPLLPKVTKTFTLPLDSQDITVTVTYSHEQTLVLDRDIKPAPAPLIDGIIPIREETPSEEIYSSASPYPRENYTLRTTTGLQGEEHVVYVTVECYPVQYRPAENVLSYYESMDIELSYCFPADPVTFGDTYDLLVIAPSEFNDALQSFIDHKDSVGISTILKSTEEIFSQYEGVDEAEEIKLMIYDAVNPEGLNWGIKYVLLVGGMKGQLRNWYVPVRYISTTNEDAIISDLYYADIFKDNGTVFDDWDSNGDGVIGEWKNTLKKDVIDGVPDVRVGRLACRSLDDVTIMVDKIIRYESTSPEEKTWFTKMLLIGGDTYADSGPAGEYEAEIDTDVSAGYMEGFTFERLWASLGTLTGQSDVERAFNEGAGFVHMAGHANPAILVTHPPDDNANKITILRMYAIPPLDALYAFLNGKLSKAISNLFIPVNPRLNNGDKLPIVLVGGCHNSQFDTTLLNFLSEGISYAYGWGEYAPKCWSMWLASNAKGGSIATIGNSGLGMGLVGNNYPLGLDGWLYPRFFYNYNQRGEDYLGGAFNGAITDYVNEFGVNMDDADRQMVAQWILHGDPSLKIGGYD